MKQTYVFLVPATLAIAALVGCSRGGPSAGDSVAVVNGEPITQGEFISYLEHMPTVMGTNPKPLSSQELQISVTNTLAFQALTNLVNRKLVMQMAKDEGVYPNDGDINKELDLQSKLHPQLVQSGMQKGLSLEAIKGDLAVDLAMLRLSTKGFTVPESDVDAYIKAHPELRTTPPSATFHYILVSSDAKRKQVVDQLAKGTDFITAANTFDEMQGGRQANHTMTTPDVRHDPRLSAGLRAAIENTGQGKNTPWIQNGKGTWLIVHVDQKSGEAPKTPSPEEREMIRRALVQQKASQATNLSTRLEDKFRQAKIDVQDSTLKDEWKQWSDQVKEQLAKQAPGGSSTGASGTTTQPK